MATDPPTSAPKAANFLRGIIERDLEAGTLAGRRFGGSPGDAAHHAAGAPDPARIRTRFPPEPNGYLHVGHAKSICLNFGLARDYGGVCHLRFDDTNPEKEEQEYVDAIIEAVRWLGFDWNVGGTSHLYYASDYFDFMYRAAEALIDGRPGLRRRAERRARCAPAAATSTRPAPTARSAAARRRRTWRGLREMKGGRAARRRCRAAREDRHGLAQHQPARPGAVPHQARHAPQHRRHAGASTRCTPTRTRSRTRWSASRTASARSSSRTSGPFYDWLLENLADLGLLAHPLPQQYEFGRLNLS